MSKIEIMIGLLRAIEAHGERTYPEECCGILLGRRSARDNVVVERLIAADNEREQENRHNRYLIPPQLVLAAERSARCGGLDIVGYYHSHPDHPAQPSDFDRDHAWPDTSYVITAVARGKAVTTRGWRLADDRESFLEQAIEIHDPEATQPQEVQR
jgi:proteasome lid subunit RPN8/RPN11